MKELPTEYQDRYDSVLSKNLLTGNHEPNGQMCVMEAAAYIAGEPWSNRPVCVCPTITAFMISWNDSLSTDEARNRLLKPLLVPIMETRSSNEIATQRAYKALDWLVRVYTPAWLDMTRTLRPHAKTLQDLDEIVDAAGAIASGKLLSAAGAAAWDAAGAAAWATCPSDVLNDIGLEP